MLQRLCAITALVATAAAMGDAMKVHVKIHHLHKAETNATTAPSTPSDPAPAATFNQTTADGGWRMATVTSIQARVQGDAPAWDAKTKTWVGGFGKTHEEQRRGVLDTVNTASVEGALMYVQAEGINVKEQSVKCERKNKMQYVVFSEITIVQPEASVAYYGGKHSTPEYCPFVAMDGGKCTEAGSDIPDACKQFDGLDGQPELGHCVGANEQTTDPRAPYPGNYWFSFPNSCVTKGWKDKNDECRTENPGGLCPEGVMPDGETCTYQYKILGYINIDDLVGITDGSGTKDGVAHKNFTEFCHAGGVEFSAENTGSGFKVEESIKFWEKPGDEAANAARTKTMVEKYNLLAPKAKTGVMTPLPDLVTLSAKNPPCYLNDATCASAENGCRRKLYSQICEVCTSAAKDCVKAPADFKFPTLVVPEAEEEDDEEDDDSNSGSSFEADESSAPGPVTPLSDSTTDVRPTKKSAAVMGTTGLAAAAVGAIVMMLL